MWARPDCAVIDTWSVLKRCGPPVLADMGQVQSAILQEGDSLEVVVRWRLAASQARDIAPGESLRVEVRVDSMGATASRARLRSSTRHEDTLYVPAPGPGETAPDALVGERHLTTLFGHGFVALLFSDKPMPGFISGLESGRGLAGLTVWRLSRTPVGDPTAELHDATGLARQRYGAAEGGLVLVRPDGYVMARWPLADATAVNAALAPYRSPLTSEGEPS